MLNFVTDFRLNDLITRLYNCVNQEQRR